MKFEIIKKIEEKSIKNFGCICIAQHHTKIEHELMEIYKNSLVPFIYDCQNIIEELPKSKTILKKLGN